MTDIEIALEEARDCLKRELGCSRTESTLIAIGALPTPSGMLFQRGSAKALLAHFNGDTSQLLQVAGACRIRAQESDRDTGQRLEALRAKDLCEQAAALVTLTAGPERAARERLAQQMLDRGFSDALMAQYRVVWTLDLPAPEDLTDPPCMSPLGRAEMLFAQVFPRRKVSDCCWYHEGDWHLASRTAIRLARAIGAAELRGGDEVLEGFVEGKLAEWGVSGWQQQAVCSLLLPDQAILPVETDTPGVQVHHNGRHRTHAMLAAGVRRTVVLDD